MVHQGHHGLCDLSDIADPACAFFVRLPRCLHFEQAYFIFHTRLATGVGFDASMSSAWTCAWLVLLPAMRVDTSIESQVPGYRTVRHLFRVLAFAGWFYYFDVHEQMRSAPTSSDHRTYCRRADPFYPPIPIGERPMGRVPDDIVAA